MILNFRVISYFLVAFPFLLSNVVTVSGFMLSTNKEGMDFLEKNGEKEGINTSDITGVQHKVIKKGTGTAHPTEVSEVVIDFEGRLLDGHVFESSFDKEEPSLFSLDAQDIIKGWVDILVDMVEGDKFEVYIPAELAYGSKGNQHHHIGPGEVLIYVIELIEVVGHSKTALYCTVTAPTSSSAGEFGSRGCNEQEEIFVLEASKWDLEELMLEQRLLVKAEPARGSNEMERESKHWILRRFHILKQIRAIKKEQDAEF